MSGPGQAAEAATGQGRLGPENGDGPPSTDARGGGAAGNASSDPEFGRCLTVRDLIVALALGLVAMGIALTYRSAIVPTDPWHYVQGAIAFPEGTWRPEGLSRWGFLLPIIPFARIWGDAAATYYVMPLLSTGVLAAVLYLLGTRYVARTAGVLGALLALATPLVFVNLTRAYTDLTATTLVGAAILLATLAEDHARRAEAASAGWGWRVPALLAACGFVTGWSFEVRETAVFAWPVIGWILWRIGHPLRTLAWFVPPALAWLALDLGLNAVVYGDPLLKLRHVTGADISSSEVSSDSVYVGQTRWWYMTVILRSIWAVSGGPALLLALLVGVVGGLLLRAQLGRLWAWGMLSFGLLWLQGGTLDPAHPSVRLDVARYWLSFIVPLLLVAAGVAVIVVRRSRGTWRVVTWAGAGALALGLLIPSVRFATNYPGFAPNGGNAMAELRDHLAETGGMPDQRIWTDWGTQRILPTYQVGLFGDPRWDVRGVRSLNRLLRPPPVARRAHPQPGEYVVLYSAEDRTCWHCRRALAPVEAAFGPFPGPGWEEVFTSSAGNLTLYRLPEGFVWPEAVAGTPDDGSADAGASGIDPEAHFSEDS